MRRRSRSTRTASPRASSSWAATRTSRRTGLSTRSHSEYVEGEDLYSMIQEDLVAERIAVESYTEMIHYIGEDDPTTRRILEEILAKEEEHADELLTLLGELGEG